MSFCLQSVLAASIVVSAVVANAQTNSNRSNSQRAGKYTLRIVKNGSAGQISGSTFSSSSFSSSSSSNGGEPNRIQTSSNFTSNCSLTVEIESSNPDELKLITGIENIRGTDDQGRVVRGPETGSMSFPFPSKAGVRKEMLALQVPEGAISLKSLEGDLVISTGSVRILNFDVSDIKSGATKSVGGIKVTLEQVKETDAGYELTVACEMPAGEMPRDVMDRVKQMMKSQQGLSVEMSDANGQTFGPTTMTSGGGSSDGFSSSSGFSSNGGSFSFSNGSRDLGSKGGSKVVRQNLTFSKPSDGQVKSLVIKAIENKGESKSIPFKFTDIKL